MAVIALSQQLGSRGIELGSRTAQRIGYRFLSTRELMSETARRYGVSEEQLLVFDERAPHFWEWFTTDTRSFVTYVRAVVLSELARDRVVVAGKGVAHMLPRCGCGLRVRTVGPLEDRARRVADEEGLSAAAAERRVRDFDRELRARSQSVSGVNLDDPTLYDVILNTSSTPLDRLADGLASLARAIESEAGDDNWRVLRDAALAEQVRAALVAHPKIRDARIEVQCAGGRVRMFGAGLVAPWNELVEEVAREVEGVAAVEVSADEPPVPPYRPA
jgi:cytidylate kinase